MEHEPWLKDVFVFLAVAGLIVPLFHRARIGAVLGFLVGGVMVGPYGLGLLAGDYPWIRYLTIEDRARVALFAELGVVFLLFTIGLEVSLPQLWSLRRYVLGLGGVQFALSSLAIGTAIALAGYGAGAAIVLGLCLAMSSTAIVVELLEEQGRTGTQVGRVVVSVLLFQDLMVAPVLLLTGAFGRGGETIALLLAVALLQAVAAVAIIIGAGRYLLRPLLRFTAATGSRDLIMAITVLIVVGIAGATGLAGLSTGLGAFLAGLLLAETEYRHHIEVDLEPFKGLLLGLFFITVGMTIDVRAVWAQAPSLALALAGLLVVKAAIVFAVSRAFALPRAIAGEAAFLLPQAGEFAFVVVGLAGTYKLLSAELAQLALAVVGLSMMVTPLLAIGGRHIGNRLQQVDHNGKMPDGETAQLTNHVIIGGFGRVGQTIGRVLAAENVPFVALDADASLVAEHSKAGTTVNFGDASRVELLERAGAKGARAFVVTVNSPRAAERMVAAIVKLRPDAPVFARASDPDHAAALARLGTVEVIPEAVEASLQLAARVLEGLGLPEDAVVHRVSRVREEELGRLIGRSQGG